MIDAAEYARLLGWLQLRIDDGLVPPAGPDLAGGPADQRPGDGRRIRPRRPLGDRSTAPRVPRHGNPVGAAEGSGVSGGGPAVRAAGRNVADIDVLVPAAAMAAAEAALREHGWAFPPTRPLRRALLPGMDARDPADGARRARRPSSISITRSSRAPAGCTPRRNGSSKHAVEVAPGVRALSPAHMILHAAAHLFHDGEIAGAIRDVVDLDGLLRQLRSRNPDSGPISSSEARASRADAPRVLRHALFSTSCWARRSPTEVLKEMLPWGPGAPITFVMDRLVVASASGRERQRFVERGACPLHPLALAAHAACPR